VKNSVGPWYRYFIRNDARATIAKIRVPILAINGDKDLMVAADENLANWKNYALAGGNHKVTTIKLLGLNHLLLACQSCDAAEMSKLTSGVSPAVLEALRDWIVKTIK
jgi:fermentation-respiration switch protein FrsA (DUF1100 family)